MSGGGGLGTIYLRGRKWWIKYIDINGEVQYESSHSTRRADAQRLLDLRTQENRWDAAQRNGRWRLTHPVTHDAIAISGPNATILMGLIIRALNKTDALTP